MLKTELQQSLNNSSNELFTHEIRNLLQACALKNMLSKIEWLKIEKTIRQRFELLKLIY